MLQCTGQLIRGSNEIFCTNKFKELDLPFKHLNDMIKDYQYILVVLDNLITAKSIQYNNSQSTHSNDSDRDLMIAH